MRMGRGENATPICAGNGERRERGQWERRMGCGEWGGEWEWNAEQHPGFRGHGGRKGDMALWISDRNLGMTLRNLGFVSGHRLQISETTRKRLWTWGARGSHGRREEGSLMIRNTARIVQYLKQR